MTWPKPGEVPSQSSASLKEGHRSTCITVVLFSLQMGGSTTKGEDPCQEGRIHDRRGSFLQKSLPKGVTHQKPFQDHKRPFWAFPILVDKSIKIGKVRKNLSSMSRLVSTKHTIAAPEISYKVSCIDVLSEATSAFSCTAMVSEESSSISEESETVSSGFSRTK